MNSEKAESGSNQGGVLVRGGAAERDLDVARYFALIGRTRGGLLLVREKGRVEIVKNPEVIVAVSVWGGAEHGVGEGNYRIGPAWAT